MTRTENSVVTVGLELTPTLPTLPPPSQNHIESRDTSLPHPVQYGSLLVRHNHVFSQISDFIYLLKERQATLVRNIKDNIDNL